MNSWNVFSIRRRKNRKYQFKVFRSVADWTVVVYILFPAAVIILFNYFSYWRDTPGWIEYLPFSLIFFFIFLLSWHGNIRTYVEEADKVFLIKNRSLFLNMKKWAYGHTIFTETFSLLSLFIFLLPHLLNYYRLQWHELFLLFIFFLSLNFLIMLIKYYVKMIEKRWKQVLMYTMVFILLSGYTILIFQLWQSAFMLPIFLLSVSLLAVAIMLSFTSLLRIGFIEHEIKIYQENRTQNIEMIFMMAPEIEKPVISKRTKPLFFRKSKRLFKHRHAANGFTELFIKSFMRSSAYWLSFLQIISVCTAGIVAIPPMWVKISLFFIFLIWMSTWLQNAWDRIFFMNPQGRKYFERDEFYIARKRAVRYFLLIGLMILLPLVLTGTFVYSSFI